MRLSLHMKVIKKKIISKCIQFCLLGFSSQHFSQNVIVWTRSALFFKKRTIILYVICTSSWLVLIIYFWYLYFTKINLEEICFNESYVKVYINWYQTWSNFSFWNTVRVYFMLNFKMLNNSTFTHTYHDFPFISLISFYWKVIGSCYYKNNLFFQLHV